jgi:hypothetical protein
LLSIPSSEGRREGLFCVGDEGDAVGSSETNPWDGSKVVGGFKMIGETVGRNELDGIASGTTADGTLG